jgi:hypothetical protein
MLPAAPYFPNRNIPGVARSSVAQSCLAAANILK